MGSATWLVSRGGRLFRMAHHHHDLTGIAGPADNEKGLEDARRRLDS
jgi:hypothetical protein